jgi:hypothetical protein
MRAPKLLVKTGQRRRVHPGKAQGAIGENSFAIDDVLQHFTDGPFAFGIGEVVFLAGNGIQQFPELFRIPDNSFPDIFFFDQVDIALVSFGWIISDFGIIRLINLSYWLMSIFLLFWYSG